MKKLNKLFFTREYTKGMWAVHIMRFSVVYHKFWIVRIAYLRNIGVDVVLVSSKEAAVARVKAEKTQYLEALKYIHK